MWLWVFLLGPSIRGHTTLVGTVCSCTQYVLNCAVLVVSRGCYTYDSIRTGTVNGSPAILLLL